MMHTDGPQDKPCNTLEELLEMTSSELIALTDDQLTAYLAKAIEDTERILASVPKRKATAPVDLNKSSGRKQSAHTSGAVMDLIKAQFAARGLDINKITGGKK